MFVNSSPFDDSVGKKKGNEKLKPSFRMQKIIDHMLTIDPINRPISVQQI